MTVLAFTCVVHAVIKPDPGLIAFEAVHRALVHQLDGTDRLDRQR